MDDAICVLRIRSDAARYAGLPTRLRCLPVRYLTTRGRAAVPGAVVAAGPGVGRRLGPTDAAWPAARPAVALLQPMSVARLVRWTSA